MRSKLGFCWLAVITCAFTLMPHDGRADEPVVDAPQGRPKFDREIIDQHRQLYDMSCIPSSIEMILKESGRAQVNFYGLQEPWKNKSDGNYADFDKKTIRGLTFHHQFNLPRNDQFPLEKLFARIHHELKSGRFVSISLKSGNGIWHMHVIYGEDPDGDFVAFTKYGAKTGITRHIKDIVTKMKGTDILTYQVAH
jgi:hypothetical protein